MELNPLVVYLPGLKPSQMGRSQLGYKSSVLPLNDRTLEKAVLNPGAKLFLQSIGAVFKNNRRSTSACWHVHKDLYTALFSMNPSARIKTACADYKGFDNFIETFEKTGDVNMGNMFNPQYMRDCCKCND